MCARHERVPQTPSPRALWHLEASLRKGDSGELALQRHAQEKPHDKEASGEDQGIQALLLQPTPQILGVSFPVFMHKIRPHILKTGDRTPLKRGVGEQWPGSPWLGDPCRAPLVGPQLPPRWPRGPRCPMMPQLTSFLRSKGSESDRKLDPGQRWWLPQLCPRRLRALGRGGHPRCPPPLERALMMILTPPSPN